MHRRAFLQSLTVSAAALGRPWHGLTYAAENEQGSAERPLLEPTFESTICPWSPAHPRNDHQLIFPLSGGRLMLVWCQYYNERPELAFAKPTSRAGGVHDQDRCRIAAKVSRDRGRTWSASLTLQDNLWKWNVKHPSLVRLPSGEILFFFVGWDSMAERNVFLKRSTDEGNHWSEIERISEPGWYCHNNGRALTLSGGRILVPAHTVIGGGPYRGGESRLESFVYYSDDGFRTWRRSADSMTIPGRGAHEPSIVELRDGRLLCLLRNTQGFVYQAFSSDQGEHWTEPEPTALPGMEAPPLVARIPKTGDLLVIWNNRSSARNFPRTPLSCAISSDEGGTWKHVQDLHNDPQSDAAYVHVFFQDDEALVTYYTRKHTWNRGTEVALKIFNVDQFYSA